MRTRHIKVAILLGVCLSLLGMGNRPAVAPGPITSVENFVPFGSARSFDPPGRIYRIDPSGAVWAVTRLDVEPQRGIEIIPSVSRGSTFTVGEVLDTIGVVKQKIPVKVSAVLSRKQQFSTSSVNGERRFLDDVQVDSSLPRAMAKVALRSDNRYYLIRETIATDNLTFKASRNWITELGIDAEFRQLVANNSSIKWTSSSEFSMDKNFGQKLDVWYAAERLTIKPVPGGGPGQYVFLREPAKPDELAIPGDLSVSP